MLWNEINSLVEWIVVLERFINKYMGDVVPNFVAMF